MLYETKLTSLPELIREIGILDLDEGIRVFGEYKGKRIILFVTRSTKGYAVAGYTLKRVGKELGFPDKQLFVEEFEQYDKLVSFLNDMVSKPIEAFSY